MIDWKKIEDEGMVHALVANTGTVTIGVTKHRVVLGLSRKPDPEGKPEVTIELTPLQHYRLGELLADKEAIMDQDWHDFGWAIDALKSDKRVARDGWNGRGMWLALQRPDEQSKMTLPYIYMSTVTGDLVPWLASQTDMLAEDWHLAG